MNSNYAYRVLYESAKKFWRERLLANNFLAENYFYLRYGRRLEEYRDIYRGQRCFIIGTGPSIISMNLRFLKNEITFGVNALFYSREDMGFDPTFYCISDELGNQDWKHEIRKLASVKIFSCPPCSDIIEPRYIGLPLNWRHHVSDRNFAGEAGRLTRTFWGSTVIIDLCLQVAFYMGFDTVYLIGCDCTHSGTPHAYGQTAEEIENYFLDTERVFPAYEFCREVYEKHGRKIYNAGIGGKLEVFERVEYEALFK